MMRYACYRHWGNFKVYNLDNPFFFPRFTLKMLLSDMKLCLLYPAIQYMHRSREASCSLYGIGSNKNELTKQQVMLFQILKKASTLKLPSQAVEGT